MLSCLIWTILIFDITESNRISFCKTSSNVNKILSLSIELLVKRIILKNSSYDNFQIIIFLCVSVWHSSVKLSFKDISIDLQNSCSMWKILKKRSGVLPIFSSSQLTLNSFSLIPLSCENLIFLVFQNMSSISMELALIHLSHVKSFLIEEISDSVVLPTLLRISSQVE